MLLTLKHSSKSQSGFTLIEMMVIVAIIGILAAIATVRYQNQVRKTHIMTIYQTINQFRQPYQILTNDGGDVTSYSPSGLNMPVHTQYCQFSVTAPNTSATTYNAIQCQIQNLNYLSSQTLSLDRGIDGNWTCRASSGIASAYLPQACQ